MVSYAKTGDVNRLRSEIRKLQDTKKDISPFLGVTSGNYWTQTGMPWVGTEGRKAVLTEWFWQPVRGQPRRVDTNELRQFSQTFWVNACVKTIIDEVASLEWDMVPTEGYEFEQVEVFIQMAKEFLEHPNKNGETFEMIIRALIKDILELDAGVLVKVFDMNSYDFDELEAKSGAPLLKPIGQRTMTELYARDGASFLKEADKFGYINGYWQYSYQIPAHPMWFNKDEICYISEQPRSLSPYGYARTQAVMDIIKSLHYSTIYNKRFFEENPIPDGALSLLDTNEAEMKTFLDWWNREFKAQPHKLAVINKDIKWQPFNVTNKELEFLETQSVYFKWIISMFGLTPTELGLTEDVNRSTSSTQAEVTKRKGIRPFLKILEQAINQDIIPELNLEGVEFTFIYDDPIEKAQKLSNWKMELDMGIRTPNEVRLELGLDPIEGGDIPNNRFVMGDPFRSNSPGIQGEEDVFAQRDKDSKREEGKETKKSLDKDKLAMERYHVNFDMLNAAEKDEIEIISTQKGKKDYKLMGYEDLIAEHKKLVATLESNNPNEIKAEAEEQKKELEQYIAEFEGLTKAECPGSKIRSEGRGRGLGTGQGQGPLSEKAAGYVAPVGQYYNDQPISHNKVNYDPVMFGMYPENPLASQVVPTHQERRGENDYDEMNNINCPYCGRNTLTNITSADDIGRQNEYRCTNCAAMISEESLFEMQALDRMNEMLTTYTDRIISKPNPLTPKGLRTEEELTTKEFVGFDYEKSLGSIMAYVRSASYRSILYHYLSDLTKGQTEELINVLYDSIERHLTIKEVTKKIFGIVKDPIRSQSIAKTEVVRIVNEGEYLTLKEQGVKRVKWKVGPEYGSTQVCPICEPHRDKIYSLDYVKGKIPVHPNCRCNFIEYFGEY